MARIRSIHPGMASDEAYMSMSIAAKAAWPILWTECDDHGVFEWKPIVLKARIFPADAIDFAELLEEWKRLGVIEQVEVDGKQFGIVRNFCKYQRPKKPTYRFPFQDEWSSFVGLKATSSPPVPYQFPTSTELPPQMKEEGGRREEVYSPAPPASGDRFEEFWAAYPRRKGENPKQPARKSFLRAVKAGCDPGDLVTAARRFATGSPDLVGTQFVPQAVTWLNQNRWEQWLPSPDDAQKSAELEAFMRTRGYAWRNEQWQKIMEVSQ